MEADEYTPSCFLKQSYTHTSNMISMVLFLTTEDIPVLANVEDRGALRMKHA